MYLDPKKIRVYMQQRGLKNISELAAACGVAEIEIQSALIGINDFTILSRVAAYLGVKDVSRIITRFQSLENIID